MTPYIKPSLMVLVPFLIGLGNIVRLCLTLETVTNKVVLLIRKVFKTTSRIPYFLWAVAFLMATIYGFVISPYSGWKLFADALTTGLVQGSVITWTSIGLYNTTK